MATLDRNGTVAVGRPLPVRAGLTASAVQISGSRSIAAASTHTRSGLTATAMAPSASRVVIPLGTIRVRAGTVAVGRIPLDRSGSTSVATILTGSRAFGSPGAYFDRGGTLVVGRFAHFRSGATALGHTLSGSVDRLAAGTYLRSGGNGGGMGVPSGLLLTLQAHPGVTHSASRLLASNIPARSGATIASTVVSGSREMRRDRSATIVTVLVPAGAFTTSGNRNRNGTTELSTALAGSWSEVKLYQRAGTTELASQLSGTRGVGNLFSLQKSGVIVVPVALAGQRAITPANALIKNGTIELLHVLTGSRVLAVRSPGRPEIAYPLSIEALDWPGRAVELRVGDLEGPFTVDVFQRAAIGELGATRTSAGAWRKPLPLWNVERVELVLASLDTRNVTWRGDMEIVDYDAGRLHYFWDVGDPPARNGLYRVLVRLYWPVTRPETAPTRAEDAQTLRVLSLTA